MDEKHLHATNTRWRRTSTLRHAFNLLYHDLYKNDWNFPNLLPSFERNGNVIDPWPDDETREAILERIGSRIRWWRRFFQDRLDGEWQCMDEILKQFRVLPSDTTLLAEEYREAYHHFIETYLPLLFESLEPAQRRTHVPNTRLN